MHMDEKIFLAGSGGIEIITPHAKLQHTKLLISNGALPKAWNEQLVNLNGNFSNHLKIASSSIFEQELFQLIADEANQTPAFNIKCRLTKNSVAIPIMQNQFLMCHFGETAGEEMELDAATDTPNDQMEEEAFTETDFSNMILPILSRSLLLRTYSNTAAPPLLSSIVKYLEYKKIRSQIQQIFFKIHSLINRSFPCQVAKIENGEEFQWLLTAEFLAGTELVLKCDYNDQGIIFVEGGRAPLKLQLLSHLQEAMLYAIKEALISFIQKECSMLFGKEKVSKFENGAIQVAVNRS